MKEVNIKKRIAMLHVGKAVYLYGVEQTISKNVSTKLKKYFENEAEVYVRYASILANSIANLNEYGDRTDDYRAELRKAAVGMSLILDDVYKREGVRVYQPDEFKEIIHNYMDKFKSPDFSDNLDHINATINDNKARYSNEAKYSFYNGVKVFKKRDITPKEAAESIILMLYARDYFNLKSILVLRKYLLNSQIANDYLEIGKLNKNPGNDLMGLLFSDYGLIDNIFDLYSMFRHKPESLITDIPLDENGALIKDNFDYVCMIIYARYITSLLLYIIECDKSGYFENEKIDKILLKIYRTFSLIILSSVYRSLSMFEFTWFSNLEILNDVCVYTHLISPRDKLDNASKMSSAIAADSRHENYDDIIDKIIRRAIKMLDKGYDKFHSQMLEYFRKSKKYGPFFDKPGFERQLKQAIIKVYTQKGMPVLGINASDYKRKDKEKS